MTLVSVDVEAVRGAVTQMESLASRARSEKTAVETAASAAGSDVSLGPVTIATMQIDTAAEGMTARVDLAIVVNSGDDGSMPDGGVLSYELPDGMADTTYNVKTVLGQELGDYAAEIDGNGDDDLNRIRDLQERMGVWVQDGQVMAEMYGRMGPEVTLDVVAAVGDAGFASESTLPMAAMLRDGLETATTWGPFPSESFADDMVQHAAGGSGFPEDGDYQGGGQSLALSYLMYDSNYESDFISAVADSIDELERNGDLQPGFWNQRAMMAHSELWQGFDEQDMEGAYDPMASVFGSMADQPSTALDWFDDPARQEYWIKERAWGHNDFRALAEVLNSATTAGTNIDPQYVDGEWVANENAEAAALLASATVEYLPQNGGFGFDDGGMFGGDSWGGESAGGDLANIISTYMPAVHRGLQGWDQEPPGVASEYDILGNSVDGLAVFDRDSLGEFIQVASRSEEGFAELRGGLSSYSNELLGRAAEGSTPGDSLSPVSDAVTGLGNLEGFFAYQVGGGDISEAAARDARNQAWVDLGSDALGAIPVPGGPVTGFVADQAVSFTTDQVGDAITGNEGVEVGEQNDLAENGQRDYQLRALWALEEAGALPHQQDPGSEGYRPLEDGPGVSNGAVMSADDIAALPEDERAAARDAVLALAGTPNGLGAYALNSSLDGSYRDGFDEYFQAPE